MFYRKAGGTACPTVQRLRNGRVVAVAGLHHHAFALGGDFQLAESRPGVGFVGRVAQAVLAAQFFLDLLVDLFERHFLRDFKEAAAGFFGDALKDFLAVAARLPLGWHSPAASSAASHAGASKTGGEIGGLLIDEVDGVHQLSLIHI